MNNESAKPMVALRRTKKGKHGEPKGTITTKPADIDEIIRETYGKIYKGNVDDPNECARKYMKDYKQFLHKAPTATIDNLTGEELQAAAWAAKDTAPGVDQWVRLT